MEILVRPIHTEDDYDAALAFVDTLMDAEPGTPEGDRLDVLLTSIEAYEAQRWRVAPPARPKA
ncbi:MAG TPA: hypothetical protein VF710_00985 [Longimicrobium sp.]|jgi:HTH-type transcriptional regulator/antitoxin HigA